jgi:large subunit ribosomal protein L13
VDTVIRRREGNDRAHVHPEARRHPAELVRHRRDRRRPGPPGHPRGNGGDFVIVINAEKIALTGNKRETKLAYRHSGYPGGLRAVAYSDLLEKHPERAIEKAVRGMLPKSSLARQQLSKLKVYAGSEHPHAAQQPKPFEITQVAQQA